MSNTFDEAKKEIASLRQQLEQWAFEYYTLDNPSVSDAQYDGAMNRLKELESQFPELIEPSSPTQRIGDEILEKFTKVEHSSRMLSLDNIFDFEGLKKFDNQIKKVLNVTNNIEYFCELKIDGVSIAIRYENGKLTKAITRGNGFVGEDVTHNVLVINSIPKNVPFKSSFEVRGEIFLNLSEFEKLNSSGLDFANPRNAAAGTLRQLDSKIAKSRNLNAFFYFLMDPQNFDLHSDCLDWLKEQGFPVNPLSAKAQKIEEVITYIQDIGVKKSNIDYQTDGVVIKVNNLSLREEVGETIKFPKWAIAYKFPEQKVTTKLLDIFPTIGRTGRVTYNAKLAVVQISGSHVSAATLHNADYVKTININIGDEVFVKKAGEIIPKVIGVSKKINNNEWIESKYCPICNSILSRFQGEVDQYCLNESCPGQIEARLAHFVSKGALDVRGLGIEIIKLLIDNKFLTQIEDIFTLKNQKEELLKLERFGEKSISNLLDSIEKAKASKLDKVIFGLGIRHVGEKVATIIAKKFPSKDRILSANYENLIAINEVGDKVADSFVKFFKNEKNIELLNYLEAKGFDLTYKSGEISSIFANMKFVITGTLTAPRGAIKELIEINGGVIANAISAKTDYLIVGENVGSKLSKAEELKIKILKEDEFYKLLEEDN